MNKQAFKQRMQDLKSYRENNPGKGYWDWKVQAYQNGGRHALGVGQVFASLADMLFNKERRTPAIAAAAYYTIHQTQNDPAAAPVEAPLVEPIADAIKSIDETPYDPGEVFLLSPENQKKQMTKNPNYRVVDTNSEEDPYGIVRRAANYHKEIHGEVPVYDYIADSDTTIKRSNLMPVGTLPMGDYTPELPHAGSYNSVLYYNAGNDKLYQRAYDLNDYGPTDTKDKGASSMYIGPLRWLSRQLDKAGTPFVQRTGFVPLDEGKYYDQLPESVKKKVRERRRLRNSYEYGGEVSEFQRKTRRDIMQESLVDGRPDYNKMFQNQNEYQKDFANYWYTERAKNPKYSDQIGGDKLSSVLSNVNKATWKIPTEAMRDNMVGQGYNPTDAQINQQLNILKEKGTKGFANPKAHSYTSLRPTNTWHEGVGHMVGDNTPAILNATPNVRISNPDSSYEDYVNQANEKHAQTWDFRGNNSNLKDDQGNYYIDPNRQLTPEDISNMRSKGAKIPEQWESLEDADISELTNTFAYNMYQDPVQYMANGGEIGDEEIKYLSNWYNKRRTYAKHRIPAMNKQLDRIDYYLKPSKYRKTIYDTPVTISNDKVKQASDKDDRGEYGGYYHPNEGVVLPDNYKEWKDREPLLHELNHVVNTFNLPVFNQINSILKDKQIIDRGDKVNQYLTTPSEVQSRLMEFRKLNNLDPLKVYGIPDVREWRRSGKDANLLDTFDDDTVLELINTVASNNVSDSIQKVAEGGEIGDPDDEFTKAINTKLGRTPDGRPLQQGLKPVFDLEDAANLTPVGDVLSAKEAYDAVKQNDWLGAGLAGLGFIPFIPKGVRRIARQTPTVNRTFEQKVAEMEKRVSNRRKMMEEFYDQRNRTYELLNTPEARRRAADIDQKYGTEYNKVYDELTKEYEDVTSYVNMVEPEFVKDPDAFARIRPAETGKKISLSEDNITKPEDFPTGLIRHEIGHYVDEMAYPGGVPNNAYLRQLGKPSKYRPFEEVKDIFRSPDKALQDYRYLRNPTEKKSIMNQFDEYLMNNYTPSTYPQTTKEFKEAIEKAPDIHRNMKLLLKIHNKPSILFKDFKNRPLVNNTTKDKNKELV